MEMHLQTIGQAARECGVTIRMLRYYEQIGLIESRRKGDGSYRVYDDVMIRRLRQIVVLRKLRVPVRQIGAILDNPDAAAVVDIFRQNIDELDDEIITLSTVREILSQFVERIREATSIRLAVDMALDEDVLSAIETMTFTKNHVKENYTMDDLNKVSESLDTMKEKFVRIVRLPPMTLASVRLGKNTPESPWQSYIESKEKMDEFIKNVDLLKIKPDFRYLCYGHNPYCVMVSIPGDMEVPSPLTKHNFPGGLYAAYANGLEYHDDWNILRSWIAKSEDYEQQTTGEWCMGFEEYFNPQPNLYGLSKDIEWYDFLLPIKEKHK